MYYVLANVNPDCHTHCWIYNSVSDPSGLYNVATINTGPVTGAHAYITMD